MTQEPNIPLMRFATEEQKQAAVAGVQYRQQATYTIKQAVIDSSRKPMAPNIIQLIRDYIPGSELPINFTIAQ